jgi:hypothetical protein
MTGDVDLLAGNEVLGRNAGTDGKQRFFGVDAKFGDLHLQRNLSLGESFALRLVHILLLGLARTALDREVTIAIGSAVSSDLAVLQRQNGNRHMPTVRLEAAGHPDFLCDNASAHRKTPKQRHRGPSEVLASPFHDTSPRPG